MIESRMTGKALFFLFFSFFCFSSFSFFVGTIIDPGKVRIYHLNNVPEMVTHLDGFREFPKVKGLVVRDEIGIYDESLYYYGAKGMHVLNVPQAKIQCVWDGNEPMILDEGMHVIRAPNLKTPSQNDLKEKSSTYIQAGNIHIIRVFPGKVALVKLNNQPFILNSRREPYVFKHAVFAFDPSKDILDADTSYIKNGPLHVIRVPRGKIATVWAGSRPVLLDFREKPYLVLDNLFRFQAKSKRELFYDASEEIIEHGSIKRIIPRTGHIAIVYENGQLRAVKPSVTGKPHIFDSERLTVGQMFNVQKQTLQFPSEKTKAKRLKEFKGSEEDRKTINYEVFTTSNGARFGVRLMVVYQITDAQNCLTHFKPSDIQRHVENLVVTEMNKAVQATESTKMLQTKARTDKVGSNNAAMFSNAQDEVKDRLCADLAQFGIDIDRVSIEEAIPIDKAVIEQMTQFALRNQKISLEVDLLGRECEISTQQTRQIADRDTVMDNNKNRLLVEKAKAELEVITLRTEAASVLSAVRSAQMKEWRDLMDQYPGLAKLMQAKAIYGQKSVLPQVNREVFEEMNQHGAPQGSAPFYAQSYLPDPENILKL
jgi:hypothetical protein